MGYQFAWDAFDFELMPSYHAPMVPSLLISLAGRQNRSVSDAKLLGNFGADLVFIHAIAHGHAGDA
jgi:hypothetical protein